MRQAVLALCVVAVSLPVYALDVCSPPNVLRAKLQAGGTGGPLMCYPRGFCFDVSDPKIVASYIRQICLTPEEEFEAMKRAEVLK